MACAAPASRRCLVELGLLTALAGLLLDVRPLSVPGLLLDDFEILAQSWTWERTWAGLWRPQNEHAMPLGRLFTYGLVRLAGRPTALPRACSLVGPLALLAGLPLLYLLVRRETGQPAVAMTGVILFGVSSVYNQAVYWFAASFALLSVDTLLLALLACQHWRQSGQVLFLAAAVLLATLCPGWFALGVLGGPLCTLYLLASCRTAGVVRSWAVQAVGSLGPLAGTVLFLAVSLPRTLEQLNRVPHHQGQPILAALQPLAGLGYTLRAVVDGLLLGAFGITGVMLPVAIVVVVLAALTAAGPVWWRRARSPALLWLGLGMIGSGYLLVYSARIAWGYKDMTQPHFNRYHLLPHLGLVLFVCGGLAGRWCFHEAPGLLTPAQVRVLVRLLALCLLLQLPRGLLCAHAGIPSGTTLEYWKEDTALGRLLLAPLTWKQVRAVHEVARQRDALQHIEEMDARCRRHHISARAARAALPPLNIPDSHGSINGWDLLHGSPDPQERSLEEVKRLLQEGPGQAGGQAGL